MRAASKLIELGVDIKAIDGDGRTALHRAAESGSVSIVQMLLFYGVDAKIGDVQGATARMLAKQMRKREVDQILVRITHWIFPRSLRAGCA